MLHMSSRLLETAVFHLMKLTVSHWRRWEFTGNQVRLVRSSHASINDTPPWQRQRIRLRKKSNQKRQLSISLISTKESGWMVLNRLSGISFSTDWRALKPVSDKPYHACKPRRERQAGTSKLKDLECLVWSKQDALQLVRNDILHKRISSASELLTMIGFIHLDRESTSVINIWIPATQTIDKRCNFPFVGFFLLCRCKSLTWSPRNFSNWKSKLSPFLYLNPTTTDKA